MTRFCTQLNRSDAHPHTRKSLKYQHIFEYRPVTFYAVDYCTDALCIKDGVKIDPAENCGTSYYYYYDLVNGTNLESGYGTYVATWTIK